MKKTTIIIPFLILNINLIATISAEIEEVLITAQKREQILFKAPISITVINDQQITYNNLNRLGDISTQIPNVHIADPNGSALPIFSVRGVSMADYNVNQSSPVGVYLDKIYLSNNFTHGLTLFDLERIEVLRGPQGTFYGKNTTGGAINIISKTPDFEADGQLTLSTGKFHRQVLDTAYETPLIDQLLTARLAMKIEKADGFSTNHFPTGGDLSSTDQQSARVTFKLVPKQSLETIVKLSYGNSKPIAYAVIPIATNPGGINNLSALLETIDTPFYKRPNYYDSYDADANLVDKTQVRTRGISLAVNWDWQDARVQSATGYYQSNYQHNADSDGTPQQSLESFYNSKVKQWSQDLSLSSLSTEPFAYTIGVYFSTHALEVFNLQEFFHGKEHILPGFDPFNPDFSQSTGFSLGQRYEQEHKSNAVYGQLNYTLIQQLTLTMGLRYTKDKISQFNVNTFVADYENRPQIGLIPSTTPYDPLATYPKQQLTDHELTGTLKVAYELTPHTLFYASYSHGYRSGAFNGSAILSNSELTPVGPEFVNAYEFGGKGSLWNHQLEYSTAVFYYDYHNQQFINIVGIQQLLDSAKRSRIQGMEFELNAWPKKPLNLQLGLGLLDAKYTNGPELQQQDLSGNQLITAPNINANLNINYRIDFNNGSLNLYTGLNYRSKHWFTAFNNDAGFEDIGQSGYSLISTHLKYQNTKQRWFVSLWGNNLANKEYKTYAINLRDAFGYHYTINGAPRTYGIDIGTMF